MKEKMNFCLFLATLMIQFNNIFESFHFDRLSKDNSSFLNILIFVLLKLVISFIIIISYLKDKNYFKNYFLKYNKIFKFKLAAILFNKKIAIFLMCINVLVGFSFNYLNILVIKYPNILNFDLLYSLFCTVYGIYILIQYSFIFGLMEYNNRLK